MARTTVIRDETIVAAAREVFLTRGFRATTAEVAERAGVSEGSIFKRFRSKSELFTAAMGAGSLADPPVLAELTSLAGTGDLRANLARIGRHLVDHLRVAVPLSIMLWSNPTDDAAVRCLTEDDPMPLRLHRSLTALFEREIRLGRVGGHAPDLVARAYFGPIHNFAVLEVLYGARSSDAEVDRFLAGLLDLLWQGVEPRREARRSQKKAAKPAAVRNRPLSVSRARGSGSP